MNKIALVLLLLLFAAACGDDDDVTDPDDPGDSPSSIAGDWILQGLEVDGTAVALPDGELEMTIEPGVIRGNLGCNTFSGEIDAADDGSLTVRGLAQTERACEEQSRMEFEAIYGRALGAATAWDIDSSGLTLSSASVVIVYS